MIGVWEIVAIVFIIVLLFGGKKIPELMKGVGKGVKSFREGLDGIEEDVKRNGTSPKDSADSGTKDGASGDKPAE